MKKKYKISTFLDRYVVAGIFGVTVNFGGWRSSKVTMLSKIKEAQIPRLCKFQQT